jgi:multisubunit Na+/H+ antiporter MnhB subunit
MARQAGLVAAALLAAALGAALLVAAWTSSPAGAGLPARVAAELEASGVRHPVTAVLLNFRTYDTALEIAVLLAAWLAARSFAAAEPRAALSPAPPLLEALLRALAPVIVVVAVYLLWRGEHAPGGAFQAGALLAAGAVLASLCGVRITLGRASTAIAAAGTAAFLAVGLATLALRGAFLDYPPAWTGALILAIEAAATVSIAAALALLFDPHSER